MFGLFGSFDGALVGEKLPENSKHAVEALFSRHYNVRRVTKGHYGDNRYIVELRDGHYLNVRTDTGYTMFNQPFTYIRDVSKA